MSSVPPNKKNAWRAPPLALWMATSITLIAALAYWDEERESEAMFTDFAREQATLAHGMAVALGAQMEEDEDIGQLLASLATFDEPGRRRVFLAAHDRPGFLGRAGTVLHNPAIERALATGASTARLSRAEAAELKLQRRSAVAGIWPIESRAPGRWSAITVATAGAERDRDLRARWRLLLSVTLACGLVTLFGGIARRRERRELELARELQLAAVLRERDERLVRADKLATLGALATGIAHEVSTPLGVIIGRAEQIMPRVAGEERTQRAVQAIIDQAERIHQVMRGILGLSRGLSPTLQHVAPRRVAQAACELVEHRFSKAQVQLSLELDPELAPIACDAHLFEQVLVNLLLNACDACAAGGHVSLQVRSDNGRIRFIVLDDGGGISPLVAARATEPFFTTKPRDRGTGLGLAIANEIVKHHHGTLELSPRQDRGTRAQVALPAVRSVAS